MKTKIGLVLLLVAVFTAGFTVGVDNNVLLNTLLTRADTNRMHAGQVAPLSPVAEAYFKGRADGLQDAVVVLNDFGITSTP